MQDILLILFIVFVLAVLVPFFSAPSLFIAFIKSIQTQYPLSFKKLFMMYLRKENLNKMIEVNNVIRLHNLQLSLNEVEHFYHLGGNVDRLLDEAIKHKQNHMEFIFKNYLKSNY